MIKQLLVCVTGAISATVTPVYIAQMRKRWNCAVQVFMTKNSKNFVTECALHAHSGQSVISDNFQLEGSMIVPHIKFSTEAEILLVMPATANIISKAAHGICDDLVSSTILARKKTIIFVPSMNENMWTNMILEENIAKLKRCGYHFIQPQDGIEVQGLIKSRGAMAVIDTIISEVENILASEKVS